MLEFNDSTRSFFIKASLQADFCCLSFPDRFNRARKNSVDLFTEIILKKVKQVYQFKNERCFAIELDEGHTLLFKMHGNRANVVLFRNNIAVKLFRGQLKADINLTLDALHRELDFSEAAFNKHRNNLAGYYITLGNLVWEYWNAQANQQWPDFKNLIHELEANHFFILDKSGKIYLSLIRTSTVLEQFQDPIAAINSFFIQYVSRAAFRMQQHEQLKTLNDQIKAGRNYIQKNEAKLKELQQDTHYQLWGDLIMANLHTLTAGTAKTILTNFYDHQLVEIKLKPDLSPQKNAEVFYRKAKNQQIEINQLQKAIGAKTVELEKWITRLREVEQATELKGLQALKSSKTTKQKAAVLPYHEFEHKGFRIWVGRHAEANDELTLKHAYKEDLWLHAKDVAGSHVVIKYQAGKKFPKDVVERAAQLAAYNSKRKTDSLCPVVVTPKKFVRKRKGDPAGAVVVEREEIILVEPRLQ